MKLPECNTILYATDMGNNMRPVFLHAISMANKFQANIIMLHVMEPVGTTGQAILDMYLPKNTPQLNEAGLKDVLKVMEQRLKNFNRDEIKNEEDETRVSDIVVAHGHPADEINKQATDRNVDLIVIGTHTGNTLTTDLLGSTARALTQISNIPILIIPVDKNTA